MNFQEILEHIMELNQSGIVVVTGFGDLIFDPNNNQFPNPKFKFTDLTTQNFWIVLGKSDESQVLEVLLESEFVIDSSLEGEYQFDMIFKWQSSEYYEHHLIHPGYLQLEHTNWKLIQTFQQRERDRQLSQVFDDNDIFNI
jgi:hypothetical protein